jgi:phenylpropionate dioxygenase-like ring-hydroxylating dioxygenase large terminal subunit
MSGRLSFGRTLEEGSDMREQRDHPAQRFYRDPARSWTLPAPFYFEPDIYRQELDGIFYRSWNFVCHEALVREPGAYATTRIGDQSILVIRGKDRGLRAFYNVCQHRGHELLKGRGDGVKAVVCPYHAWSYRLDGSLRTARGAEALPDFNPDDFALKPVRLETLFSCVFVNLDPDAPTLRSQAGDLEAEILSETPNLGDLTFARRLTWDVKANWKNTVDNFLECYHCAPAHPAFTQLVDMSTYRSVCHGLWSSHKGRMGRGADAVYEVGPDASNQTFAAWWLWPNATFVLLPGSDGLMTFHMAPTGPETTFECADFYFRQAEPSRGEEEAIAYMDKVLNPEDIAIVESVQRGLHSRGYRQGRYMVDEDRTALSEHTVHHFHGLVLDALQR